MLLLSAVTPWAPAPHAQVQPAKGVNFSEIREADLREWLTYLASDDLQGRQTFTEGYGLAAEYVAARLRNWNVKPLGDQGSYYQAVRVKGYRVERRSSVTVEINGQSRTFKHGDHVTFAANSGGRQTVSFDGVEFVGYGLTNPGQQYDDFKERDLKGKLVVSVAGTPTALPNGGARGRGGRAYAVGSFVGARAAIDYVAPPAAQTPAQEALAKAQTALAEAQAAVNDAQAAQRSGGAGGRGAAAARGGAARGRGAAAPTPDFTTVLNVETPVPPQITADDVFYEYLFSTASARFSDLKARASRGEPLAGFSIPGVKVTVNIDNAFDVVSSQLTKNVVGLIEGSDPKLKDTYVMFGAHLDHEGYNQFGRANGPGPTGCRQRSPASLALLAKTGKTPQNPGRRGGAAAAPPAAPASAFDSRDVIYNGADDDGSGSAVVLGIAKAFATGPKPRRSVIVIWHADEENGLLGSRYNADFPVVPLDKVQAVLNIDMVGRDDCNNLEADYTNSVFVVGADRISTDLHNVIVDANRMLPKPLALDYEMNDIADPEGLYTRSDHYSYASKGIPIAFFTTGIHPDYHRVTDSVDKIVFPKMTRIAQLIYETGFSIANSEKTLEHDNKGPRTGLGAKAERLGR